MVSRVLTPPRVLVSAFRGSLCSSSRGAQATMSCQPLPIGRQPLNLDRFRHFTRRLYRPFHFTSNFTLHHLHLSFFQCHFVPSFVYHTHGPFLCPLFPLHFHPPIQQIIRGPHAGQTSPCSCNDAAQATVSRPAVLPSRDSPFYTPSANTDFNLFCSFYKDIRALFTTN